jgi:hypothetical protein
VVGLQPPISPDMVTVPVSVYDQIECAGRNAGPSKGRQRPVGVAAVARVEKHAIALVGDNQVRTWGGRSGGSEAIAEIQVCAAFWPRRRGGAGWEVVAYAVMFCRWDREGR